METAVQNLWDQGYVVITVHEEERRGAEYRGSRTFWGSLAARLRGKVPASEAGTSRFSRLFGGRVSNRELIFFAVQLSTLLKAGVPLIRGLDIIFRGAVNPAFRTSIESLKRKVSGGSSLYQALRAQGKVFPWIWVNLVEVGESTGKLPECLEEIARYQESAARIKSKVITALFYPGILTVAVISALTFLLLVIVPKFTAIFESQHLKLPALTQFVVGVSNLVRYHFTPVAIGIAVLVAGSIYYGRRPRGRIFFDTFRLGAPVFGKLILQVAVVRFCRSLGTLLRSGVSILEALGISGRLLENRFLESKIQQVSAAVRSGQSLGVQLEARHVFPVFMTQLLMIGEETGQLERFLDLLANYYEEQVDTFLSRLTVLLEPILLVFMGGVIGTIVISMFLPIVELSTGGGMGG
jgi:type IV pilus assembly protein PilC